MQACTHSRQTGTHNSKMQTNVHAQTLATLSKHRCTLAYITHTGRIDIRKHIHTGRIHACKHIHTHLKMHTQTHTRTHTSSAMLLGKRASTLSLAALAASLLPSTSLGSVRALLSCKCDAASSCVCKRRGCLLLVNSKC